MGPEEETEAKAREEARRMGMRSTTPQKISLLSFPLPKESPDPPGMSTPPFRSPASVPFQWEEAPGKALRPSISSSAVARSLELPPRLQLTEASNNKLFSNSNRTPSPTTVLDGPYVGRSSSCISYSVGRSPPTLLGSFRRGTGRPDDGDYGDGVLVRGSVEVGGEGTTSLKGMITRLRRTGSSLSVPSTKSSHLWARISGGFKQVLPWRRRTTKKDEVVV